MRAKTLQKQHGGSALETEGLGVLRGGLPQKRQDRLSTCHGRSASAAAAPPHPHLPHTSQEERSTNCLARGAFVPSQSVPTLMIEFVSVFDRVVEGGSLASGVDRGIMY
jgi:hypothetical protein